MALQRNVQLCCEVSHSLLSQHADKYCQRCRVVLCCSALRQAELKTDMHAGLTAAERRELAELQPAIEGLAKELAAACKARSQVCKGWHTSVHQRCSALVSHTFEGLPFLFSAPDFSLFLTRNVDWIV